MLKGSSSFSTKVGQSTEKLYTNEQKKIKLEVRGRARREAARRRKSSAKSIQEDEIPLAVMAGRRKMFSENTCTIPEVMDFSTLNFKANFKFS